MNRFISIHDINPLKRALKSLKISSISRYRSWQAMRSIAQHQSFFNQLQETHMYSDNMSYSYRLFDFTKQENLHHFNVYTDNEIGGSSNGKLYFDSQNKCLTIEGIINDKDKQKLTNFPSIGMARIHNYPLNCGPFNAINIQIQSDGLPIHFGVQIFSKVYGVVPCYGIIASKVKGWRNYELPFLNMILVGSEDNIHKGMDSMVMNTNKQGTTIGNDHIDMRRIILTEATTLDLYEINIRMLGTKTAERKISIRNINLIRRSKSQSFFNQYLHPYFYLVDNQPYITNELGISKIAKGYESFNNINIGDKVYKRIAGYNNNKA